MPADTKLSALTASTTVDFIYGELSGVSKKITASDVVAQGSVLTTITVPLSASQINHLFSAPQTIIPAPGTGKAILAHTISRASTVGTIPFFSENGAARLYFGSDSSGLELGNIISNSVSNVAFIPITSLTYADIENQPIVAAGAVEDLVNGGAIVAASVAAGGAGYAPGGTGTVNPTTSANYVVDTVGGGGAVTAFHFSDPGYGNNTGVHATAVTTGGGDGNFTLNITSITPGNGAGSVTIVYQILTLP